jgi:hypothetical protein
MSEEREEGPITTEELDGSFEEREIGPTSIDVTDEAVSMGPTSIDVTDEQASIVETPTAEQQEEKVQDQNKQIEQAQEESKIRKRKQKRRITSYLSNILKQVEKQGNQINKLTLIIQSLQKQKQTKPIINAKIDQTESQSIKQIKTQVNQLQRQITRIQDDVLKIKPVTGRRQGTSIKVRKRAPSSSVKPRSKKTKPYRSIQSGKQKRTARNRLKSKP